MLVFYCTHGWALKRGGGGLGGGGWGGGAAPPLCKHIMIRATFPYCKNGDDMMFVFLLQAWMGFRATFPYCTHGDDMMFVFIASMDGLYKSGGG